ncbi:MAG TPA: sulfite exporter TauE/SafE family protein [Acidimicrobiia bacterium]|jgi:hypothetical protein
MDWWVALGGLIVGFVVGLTGMGGGALMTPLLIVGFGVQPLAAVSSDLVASLVMKPFGAGVHLKHGTVNMSLVRWLVIGSVPAAFCGVLLLEWLGSDLNSDLSTLLGIALLLAGGAIVARTAIQRRRGIVSGEAGAQHALTIRPLPTVLIGIVGGLVVGITSVGSGSLMIVFLLLLYPSLSAGQLVGTDLVQAIPLVASAALGHILFGDFQLGLTTSILVGAIPGTYLGARLSSRAPDAVIRPVLVAVLALSGLKLLGMSNTGLFVAAAAAAVVLLTAFVIAASRRRLPARAGKQSVTQTV